MLGSPSRIRLAFAVVPPMSKEMAFGLPERARHPGGGDDAADGPGLHHRHGTRGGDFGRHDAAVRLHDGELAAERRFPSRLSLRLRT